MIATKRRLILLAPPDGLDSIILPGVAKRRWPTRKSYFMCLGGGLTNTSPNSSTLLRSGILRRCRERSTLGGGLLPFALRDGGSSSLDCRLRCLSLHQLDPQRTK